LSIDIDIIAVIILESLGVISFLAAFLFYRQRQRINNKHKAFLNSLSRQLISERGDGKCFSSEWLLDNVISRRKRLLSATPILIGALTIFLAIFYYGIGPLIVAGLLSFGYASVIGLLGVSVLLSTDAFEAYSYTNAINKATVEQLDKEDQSYIELAKEAVEKAFLRFFSLGVAFALLGPFIPQIFNGVASGLALYTSVLFLASEATSKVSVVFATLIVFVLPALLLLLPEFFGRILFRKGKFIGRKVLRRGAKK